MTEVSNAPAPNPSSAHVFGEGLTRADNCDRMVLDL
jgi:hypothetical protein